MAAASVIPLSPVPSSHLHQCARCFGPATTRCAQCKSVWYCSGKCQILNWREVHKHECMRLNNTSNCTSPRPVPYDEVRKSVTSEVKRAPQSNNCTNQPINKNTASDNIIQPPPGFVESEKTNGSEIPLVERKSVEKRSSRKNIRNRGNKGDDPSSEYSDDVFADSGSCNTTPNGVAFRNKEKESIYCVSERDASFPRGIEGNDGASSFCTRMESIAEEGLHWKEPILNDELAGAATERATIMGSNKAKIASHLPGSKSHKSPKLSAKEFKEQSCSESDRKGGTENESKRSRTKDASHSQGRDSISSIGIMKMFGMIKPSKHERRDDKEVNEDRHRKLKMLFPYEDFVKLFQSEHFFMSPRGLMNIGNSCYANAVLQCLTCTKPLAVFLLQRSHSRSCCVRSWCLMCELEQHLMMLRESGGPLSSSRIISHIRSNNCQIGDGSQEDAHEFLRLLIASMQTICLESSGGENVVDPRLQETTFIQHTFGGRLISKPPSGTPVTFKDIVVCKYPRDPTVALGFVSVVFLAATSFTGYFSLFYPYKGKSVPRGALLFQNTGLLVFFFIALGLTGMAGTFLLWPTITEQLHLSRTVHHNMQTQCPTAKTCLLGGGAFLLNTALIWLVSLMLADNAREDYFDDTEGKKGGRDVQLTSEYEDTERAVTGDA